MASRPVLRALALTLALLLPAAGPVAAAPAAPSAASVDSIRYATTLADEHGAQPCRLVPKIPMNRSYFDASSALWFSTRSVTGSSL